jgi:nucleosome assembly protein 1-like 1
VLGHKDFSTAMQTLAAWEYAIYVQQQSCAPAEPLYKERSEVVLGQKDVPISYADGAEEGEEAEEAAEKKDTPPPAEEEGEIPAGVPEFWLGAMRAHPLISEHVRLAIPF